MDIFVPAISDAVVLIGLSSSTQIAPVLILSLMSSTAENLEQLSSSSTEGLEDLYEIEAQTDLGLAQADPIRVQDDGIPLADAAELLDLHIDTVRKRLQKGKLAGYKSDQKYGQKWFVCRSELDHLITETHNDSAQDQADPTQKAQTNPGQVQSNPTQKAQADPTPVIEIEPESISDFDKPIIKTDSSQLLSVIENQAHQLKAAGDVIMYMRSQLEQKDQELKLLIDKQNQPTRWYKFVNWFLGR